MARIIRYIVLVFAAIAGAMAAAAAPALGAGPGMGGGGGLGITTVTLRAAADLGPTGETGRVPGDGTDPAPARAITLGDIAQVDGPEAERLGAVVVVDDVWAAAGHLPTLAISIDRVRTALDGAGVHWGRTTLRGGTCMVNLRPVGEAKPAPAHVRTGPIAPTLAVVDPAADAAGPTVRGLIATRLADLFRVPPADLRLGFDDDDRALLDRPATGAVPGDGGVSAPTRTDIRPAGTGGGADRGGAAKVPVYVHIYQGERLAVSKLLTVRAQVRRTVLTARGVIPRGAVLTPDLIDATDSWVGPGAKSSPPLSEVVGKISQTRLSPGTLITADAAASPVVVKRGDLVYVHALSGPFNVQVKCRALGSARDGELVELRAEGSKETFTARMDGPGRAIKVIGGGNTPGGSAAAPPPAGVRTDDPLPAPLSRPTARAHPTPPPTAN